MTVFVIKLTEQLSNLLESTMLLKFSILLIGFICYSGGVENKARYDNYRMYHVHFTTEDQVKVFAEIEARSDSYIFIGHAREINQKLSILVAAHKVAEITDIIDEHKVEYEILVSFNNIRIKI